MGPAFEETRSPLQAWERGPGGFSSLKMVRTWLVRGCYSGLPRAQVQMEAESGVFSCDREPCLLGLMAA